MDITLRHDASRIVQAILQFGTSTQQEEILEELYPKLAEICKTPYGHFVILKAIHYCQQITVKKRLISSLSGHFVSLSTHVIGARVVETLLQLYPHHLTNSLKLEFYGKVHYTLYSYYCTTTVYTLILFFILYILYYTFALYVIEILCINTNHANLFLGFVTRSSREKHGVI
jgi:hypothetical protein